MTVFCNTCHQSFESYKELALHIITNKKTHKKGRLWASKYTMKQRALDMKTTIQNRNHTPLTEQDRENKKDTRRELSGRLINTNTICPACKKTGVHQFEIEYIKDPDTWRMGNNFVRLCPRCGGQE
jgi:hypothetical protein